MPQTILYRMSAPSIDPTLDGFSNGFVMESATATDYTQLGTIAGVVESFYTLVPPTGTHALEYYMSPTIDAGANHATWEAYDISAHLDGTPHGGPVANGTWTITPSAGLASYPEGVAACVSFQSAYGTADEFGPVGSIPTPPDIIADYGAAATHTGRTRPRARDRNRVYVGPLNSAAFSQDGTTKRTELNATFINDALLALQVLATGYTSGGFEYNLKVWSRRDAQTKLPTEAWMDNRPDYQRRRSDPAPGLKTFKALS